jgi:hypothetical protein
MSIDYFSCDRCGESFPDVIDFVSCDCGINWCSSECAEGDGYREEPDGYLPEGDTYERDTSCKYCRHEDFSDSELLSFSLTKLNMNRKGLIDKFKEEHFNDKS